MSVGEGIHINTVMFVIFSERRRVNETVRARKRWCICLIPRCKRRIRFSNTCVRERAGGHDPKGQAQSRSTSLEHGNSYWQVLRTAWCHRGCNNMETIFSGENCPSIYAYKSTPSYGRYVQSTSQHTRHAIDTNTRIRDENLTAIYQTLAYFCRGDVDHTSEMSTWLSSSCQRAMLI